MQHNDTMNSQKPAPQQRRWLLGAGLAAAVAGAGVAWWRLQPGAVQQEAVQGFWRMRFVRPTGGELALADFRGRPLLVNFWATWCPPCVEELPMIEALWRENAVKGAQVVALAIDQPSSVRRFLDRQSLTFPVGLAGLEGTELARGLGNLNGGLPFSVFFRADGSIFQRKLGQLTQEDLVNGFAKAV
jgi:thiol-disulfide isomerase/thioredoxin